VWTDGRGFATVTVPAEARSLRPPLEYTLRVLEGDGDVHVATELWDGRFTIETDQPHVKVAWRITGSPPAINRTQAPEEES
jgi:hypothetical protein